MAISTMEIGQIAAIAKSAIGLKCRFGTAREKKGQRPGEKRCAKAGVNNDLKDLLDPGHQILKQLLGSVIDIR